MSYLFNEQKIILDLCGGSGSWSKPYSDNNYDVRLMDIKHGSDVRLIKKFNEKIYGILAAPPCDNFAVSGARWWKNKGEKALLESLSVLDACLRIIYTENPVFWALENPVGRIIHYIGDPVLYFNPRDFGDNYTKRTGLWGKFNIPAKNPVKVNLKVSSGNHCQDIWINENIERLTHKNRKELRSITPPGFAKAFFEANK